MPQIFIHADDFGNTINISKCIYKCFKDGSLNSTSIIVNTPCLEESLKLIKDTPIRKVLHLNIVEGKAITIKIFIKVGKDWCLSIIVCITKRKKI